MIAGSMFWISILLFTVHSIFAIFALPIQVHPRHHTSELSSTSRLFLDDFVSLGSNCTRGGPFDYPKCVPGTWCVGKAQPRCVKLLKPGTKCGGEYDKCAVGCFCNANKVCEKPPALDSHYTKEGGDCSDKSASRCFPGLWCILGNCRKLIPCGKSCAEPWQVCRKGLKCRTIYPSLIRVCVTYPGISEERGQEDDFCDRPSDSKCRIGLVCTLMPSKRRLCKIPTRLGEACKPGTGICESGRVCFSPNDSKTPYCADPRSKGERCDKKIRICIRGLKCQQVGKELVCG